MIFNRLFKRCSTGFLLLLAVGSLCFGQEDYNTWPNSIRIYLNTSGSGANIPTTQTNFPVVVRINPALFSGFASTLAQGADIRFANARGAHLPYQIERWVDGSGNRDTAEIWVKADTVRGNNATQYITMFYGKTGVTSQSNPAAVFETGNRFAAVWHFPPADTFGDATANANSGTNTRTTRLNLGVTGNGRYFDSANINFGNRDALKLIADSMTVSGWLRTTQIPAATKFASIFRHDYHYNACQIQADGTVRTAVFDTARNYTSIGVPWNNVWNDGQWHYFVSRFNRQSGVTIFKDGVAQTNSPGARSPLPTTTTLPFMVGMSETATQPEVYRGALDEIVVSNTARSDDWIKFCYETQKPAATCIGLPPVIAAATPKDSVALGGRPASFAVTVTGSSAITYVWYKNSVSTATVVAGQTGATLTFASVQVSDSGTYICVASNAYGKDTSRAALLTILHPLPVITADVRDTAVLEGTAWSLSVAAGVAGNVPGVTLSYKWYRNSVSVANEIAGHTAASLSYPSAQLGDSGNYICAVSTPYGSVQSRTAKLTVVPNTLQIANPIMVRGSFIDSTHVSLKISRFSSLPATAPPLIPWYADTIIVWYRSAAWSANPPSRTSPNSAFSLAALKASGADTFSTVLTVPRSSPSDCNYCYFRASVNWQNTQTATRDSLPPFTDTSAGASVYMCDTSKLANPLKFSFLYVAPSDTLRVALYGISAITAHDWDLLGAISLGYSIGGSVYKDTALPKSVLQRTTDTAWLEFRDSRFAGEAKWVKWRASLRGVYASNRCDTAVDSCKVGVTRPENAIQLTVARTGATWVHLYWFNPSGAPLDSVRVWWARIRVPDSGINPLVYSYETMPSYTTNKIIPGLSDSTTYFFGIQMLYQGMWSYVTDNARGTTTTLTVTDVTPMTNKLQILTLAFDTLTNRIRVVFKADTAGLQLEAGITWATDSAVFNQPDPPLKGKVVPIADPTQPTQYYIDIATTNLQFDRDYYFGIWLRKVDGNWIEPTTQSTGMLHIPRPLVESVIYFTTADTIYGLSRLVRLRRDLQAGADLYVQAKLLLVQLPVESSGCIPVSSAFRFDQRNAPPLPLWVGVRYDSIPAGFSAGDIRIYHYDATGALWLVDTLRTEADTAGRYVSVRINAADCRYPFIAMIDTVRPELLLLSDTAAAVPAAKDIAVKIRVRDNIANSALSMRCGRGDEAMLYRKSLSADAAVDTLDWVIPGDMVIDAFGVRAKLYSNDGRFIDSVDISRDVIRAESDVTVLEYERWMPIGATAVLDSPDVAKALRGLVAPGAAWSYDIYKFRLFRWAGSGWTEYAESRRNDFSFAPGRAIWLKTRLSGVINLGTGRTVSLRRPHSIILQPKTWTDICLPYCFNIRVGDVLLATTPAADETSLLFYEWKVDAADKMQRYITEGVYMPLVAGRNDKKYELDYGEGKAYSVFNDKDQAVELKIPPTPIALSAIQKRRLAQNGWAVAIRPVADGHPLSPVYCGFAEGSGTAGLYPMPPGWSEVSVGVYDRARRQLFGGMVARGPRSGGGAYELVFRNTGDRPATVEYTVEPLAGLPDNMRMALLSASNVAVQDATGRMSIDVAAGGSEYRWLAVGSPEFIGSFGHKLTRGEFSLSRIYPNPLHGAVRIEYSVPSGGISSVRCEIIDQLGRTIWSNRSGKGIAPGKNVFVWNAADRGRIAAGAYIVRLSGFDGTGKKAGEKRCRVMYLPQ
jgi:hypothetical protein